MKNQILKNYTHKQSTLFPKIKLKNKPKITFSKEIAFIDDFNNKKYFGLKEYELFFWKNKPVYIFDNHNFALFAFWEIAQIIGPLTITHFDAHKDNAKFQYHPPQKLNRKNILNYTKHCRISDYLDLGQQTGLIKKIKYFTQSWDFKKSLLDENFVLNLDIDIFGFESMIKEKIIKEKLTTALEKSDAIIIATSPGFIEQDKAKKYILELFN